MTKVLGIETSCDETAIGIVEDGEEILCHLLTSHIETHESFGGVFPEMSSRRHFELLLPLIKKSLEQVHLTFHDLDLIAVANRPGLIGSLLMGVNCAKSLGYALNIPVIGVNHLEAHLYAAMMSEREFITPAVGLIASGGHTAVVKIDALGEYQILGQTIDDAVGEAFDKVGRLLGLAYPAGPKIERLALDGDPNAFSFHIKSRGCDFSYSGLKTQALYLLKGQNQPSTAPTIISEEAIPDFAASFQEAALQQLVQNTKKACKMTGLQKVYVGGGVANNERLRKLFDEITDLDITWPQPGLSLDNGAMIAGLGYHVFKRREKQSEIFSLTALPTAKTLTF